MRSGNAREGYFSQINSSHAISDRDFLQDRMEKYLQRIHQGDLLREREFPPTTLTISRQCGAGFNRLERHLLEYLDHASSLDGVGWAVFDQSLLGRIVEAGRSLPGTEPFFRQNSKFPVSKTLEEFLNLPADQWTLFNYTASTIRSLARNGNAIIIGRAGNFITSDLANTFHVRLVADKEGRTEETARRYGIPVDEATEMVVETDKARARFVKRYTGADIDDASCYHLVMNTRSLADELVVRIIGDSFLEWSQLGNSLRERQATPQAASA